MRLYITVAAVAFSLVGVGTGEAAEPAEGVPTFSKDVAPILYENCVVCHREGEIAPMSLVNYQDARPWSRGIKAKVVAREMPPWYADRRFGAYSNERGLAQEDIDTIVSWVDGGAPRGLAADMPSVPDFPVGWAYGDPDIIIPLPVEVQLPAEGEIDTYSLYSPMKFEQEEFIDRVHFRPGNARAVHHSGGFIVRVPDDATIVDGVPMRDGSPVPSNQIQRLGANSQLTDGASKIVSYVPGRGMEQYPEGIGKRIPEGWSIRFSLHYQATGKPETDLSRLGLWNAKNPISHEILNGGSVGGDRHYIVEGKELMVGIGEEEEGYTAEIPVIPPHAENWAITSVMPLKQDVTLHGMSPHMHLRGKDITYLVTYPDGREEVMLNVPRYDFNWQLYYELAQPLKIPAGSKITALAHYDNSLKNRHNPAPDKEVYWAEQSWDEMFNPQMRMTVDSQDLRKTEKETTEEE
jgi:hypothetical protein